MFLTTKQTSEARQEIVLRKLLRRRRAAVESNPARCPLCHMVLVIRMGRRGPYFQCRCRR